MNAKQLSEMRQYFESQSITQKTIAELLQVSPAYVNKLFLGKKEFGKKTAEKFKDLFGLSQSWLLTGEGPMLAPASGSESSSIVNGPNSSQAVGDGATAVNGEGVKECLEIIRQQQEMMKSQAETIKNQSDAITRLIERLSK